MKETQHPELKEGEVFVTNANMDLPGKPDDQLDGFESCGWKTKRLGLLAFDVNGEIVKGLRPVFAQREELEKAGIMDVIPDDTEVDLYRKKVFYCAKLSGAGEGLHAWIRYQRVSTVSYQDATGKLALEIQQHFGIHVVLGNGTGKGINDSHGKVIELFKAKPMLSEDEVFYAKCVGTTLIGSSNNSETEALGNLFWTEQEMMKVSFNLTPSPAITNLV